MESESRLWEYLVLGGALLLVAWCGFRGWRLGLIRQLANLGALLAGCVAGFFAGGWLTPHLRPLFTLPDFLLTLIGGFVMGFLVFALLSVVGAILFKSTKEQKVAPVRFVYAGGGLVAGVLFGVVLVWLLLTGFRLGGGIAEGYLIEVEQEEKRITEAKPYELDEIYAESEPINPLVLQWGRARRDFENSPSGVLARRVDPVPEEVHELLHKLARVLRRPRAVDYFMEHPQSQELASDPRIQLLLENDDIQEKLVERRYFQLLRHPRIVAATNDPELREKLREFDLRTVLTESLAASEEPDSP